MTRPARAQCVCLCLLVAPILFASATFAQSCKQLAGNADSIARGLTADGQLALVQSESTDLTPLGNQAGLLLADTKTRQLTSVVSETGIQAAAMSADAVSIAWITAEGELRVRLPNGNIRVLADAALPPLAISANGGRVAYLEPINASANLTVQRVGDGEILYARRGATFELGGLDRTGAALVFATDLQLSADDNDNLLDVYRVNVATGRPTLISTVDDGFPADSPSIDDSGAQIAYLRGATGAFGDRTIVLTATETGEELLTTPGRSPRIDPDGDGVVYQVRVGTADGPVEGLVRASVGPTFDTLFSFPPDVAHVDGALFGDRGASRVLYTGTANLASNSDCNNASDVYLARADESNDLLTLSRMREVRLSNPVPFGDGRFGASLGVDGARVFVGSPGDDAFGPNAGRVFIYQREGLGFVLEDSLGVPDGFFSAALGQSIAVAGDTLIIGAPETSVSGKGTGIGLQAAIWQRLAIGWRFKQPVTQPMPTNNGFGAAVAIGGQTLAVGAPDDSEAATGAGAVFVFNPDADGLLSLREKLLPGPGGKGTQITGSRFGQSLAFGKNKLAVGAPGSGIGSAIAGSVSLFDLLATNLGQPVTVAGSDPEDGDEFGQSIALTGTNLVVGAPGRDTEVGSAYVFGASGANQLLEIPPFDIVAGQRFGDAIALLGNNLLIGAPGFVGDGAKGSGSGAALAFDLGGGSGTPIIGAGSGGGGGTVVFAGGDGPDDSFGAAVAVGNGLSAFGAPDSNGGEGSVAVTIDPDHVFADNLEGLSLPLATVTAAGVPSACPAGTRHERVLFFDDLEAPDSAWSTNGSWARQSERSFSGSFAWRAQAVAEAGDQILTSPIVESLPTASISGAARTMILSFRHRRTLTGNRSLEQCNDGGVAQRISSLGGASTASNVLLDPFDGTVVSGASNPLAGEEAWCGSRTWTLAAVELERGTDGAAFQVLSNRQVGFRLGTDDRNLAGEWYIDDIHVEYCLDD